MHLVGGLIRCLLFSSCPSIINVQSFLWHLLFKSSLSLSCLVPYLFLLFQHCNFYYSLGYSQVSPRFFSHLLVLWNHILSLAVYIGSIFFAEIESVAFHLKYIVLSGKKIYALRDAIAFYSDNMDRYAVKQPLGSYQTSNEGVSILKRLLRPIEETAINNTSYNYFTNVLLTDELYETNKFTFVGTIKKNNYQICLELLLQRPVNRTMCPSGQLKINVLWHHIFRKNITMLCFQLFTVAIK